MEEDRKKSMIRRGKVLRRAIISGDIQIHLILQEIWSIKGTIDFIVP